MDFSISMKTRTHQQQQTIHSIQSPFPTPTWHVSWSPSLTKSFFVEPLFYFFFFIAHVLDLECKKDKSLPLVFFSTFPLP